MQNSECPDCGVSMESAEFRMYDAKNPKIKTEEDAEGILGKFGMNESRAVETVVCPECGLLRFYAAIQSE